MVADIKDYSSIRIAIEKYIKSQGMLYKKKSHNNEQVAGLAAELNSSDEKYANIATGSGQFIGVFDKQRVPGYDSNSLLSDYYARDGFPVDVIMPFIKPEPVRAYISSTQTIEKFDLLEVSNGGTFSKWSGANKAVAVALNKITTTTDPDLGELLLLPLFEDNPFNGLKLVTETVTVATHAGTLSNKPKLIEFIEATTQTATSHKAKNIIGTSTSPSSGEVYVNYGTGAFITNSTDAVTQVKVRYWY